jgi:ATP-dependent exoDNAse (exonuclease V) alpha subunit
LLYIAMTRARRELMIHSHGDAAIVDALERATLSTESGALRLTGAV